MASESSYESFMAALPKKEDPNACICGSVDERLTCYSSKCKNLAANIQYNKLLARESYAIKMMRKAFPAMKITGATQTFVNQQACPFTVSYNEVGKFQITRAFMAEDEEDEVAEGDNDGVIARKRLSRSNKQKRGWAELNRIGVHVGQIVGSKEGGEDGEMMIRVMAESELKGKQLIIGESADGSLTNIEEVRDEDKKT